jgi:gallate dioxygenase
MARIIGGIGTSHTPTVAAGLSDEERDMVRRRDWRALIRYAAMRGQTLEEFQKTRNAQMLYGLG